MKFAVPLALLGLGFRVSGSRFSDVDVDVGVGGFKGFGVLGFRVRCPCKPWNCRALMT